MAGFGHQRELVAARSRRFQGFYIWELQDCIREETDLIWVGVLQIAQAALPDSQYWAFRKLFLNEFGHCGLGMDLGQIVTDYEKLKGKETGRPIHAGKEVPHD